MWAQHHTCNSEPPHTFTLSTRCIIEFANGGLLLIREALKSSWTKCPDELGSPHPFPPHKQLVDATDSTCAEVMHTKPEKVNTRWVHPTKKECYELSDQLDYVAMGKDLPSMGISLNMQLEHPLEELSTSPTGKRTNKLSDVDGKQLNKGHSNACEKGQLAYNSDKTRTRKIQVMNVVDAVTDSRSLQAESRDLNIPNGFCGISQTKASCCFKQNPSLEPTLKRKGKVRDAKNVACNERNVLRHSNLSAFLKYNTASSANQAQTGNVGSCSPLDNSSLAPNAETIHNSPSLSYYTPPNQQSNGSNSINDMASTNTYLNNKPETFEKKPDSVTGIGSLNSSAFQTVQNNSISSPQLKISAQGENAEIVKGQVGGSEQGFQVEGNHCQLHHYNPIAHNTTQDLQSDHGDLTLKSSTKASQQRVSLNVFGGSAESSAANYSVHGIAAETESDHGSNGQNGSSTSLTIGMVNVENTNGAAESTGVSGIDGKNSVNGADDGLIAFREAALTKFGQKRKERCFEKRVRYYSRKKLAEQRPRIRGQFVRRIVSESV